MLKKLQKIFKMGYVPDRGNETYRYLINDPVNNDEIFTGKLCNCFGHACFNLKNKQYVEYEISRKDKFFFYDFINDLKSKNNDEAAKLLLKRIEEVGLSVSPAQSTDKIKDNQWKVAMYFDRISYGKTEILRDFHFLIQQKDGSWQGKNGFTFNVETYKDLQFYCSPYYALHKVYTITNPNAREK